MAPHPTWRRALALVGAGAGVVALLTAAVVFTAPQAMPLPVREPGRRLAKWTWSATVSISGYQLLPEWVNYILYLCCTFLAAGYVMVTRHNGTDHGREFAFGTVSWFLCCCCGPCGWIAGPCCTPIDKAKVIEKHDKRLRYAFCTLAFCSIAVGIIVATASLSEAARIAEEERLAEAARNAGPPTRPPFNRRTGEWIIITTPEPDSPIPPALGAAWMSGMYVTIVMVSVVCLVNALYSFCCTIAFPDPPRPYMHPTWMKNDAQRYEISVPKIPMFRDVQPKKELVQKRSGEYWNAEKAGKPLPLPQKEKVVVVTVEKPKLPPLEAAREVVRTALRHEQAIYREDPGSIWAQTASMFPGGVNVPKQGSMLKRGGQLRAVQAPEAPGAPKRAVVSVRPPPGAAYRVE